MEMTSTPTPVYWSDGIYAIVRIRDVPQNVKRSFAQTSVERRLERDPNKVAWKANIGSSRGTDLQFCYVKIADMVGALQLVTPTQTHDLLQKVAGKAAPEPLYDGATAAQCLARYEWLQRSDGQGGGVLAPELGYKPGDSIRLTPSQKMVAESEWRKALAAKKTEVEAKERGRIVVDQDEDGE